MKQPEMVTAAAKQFGFEVAVITRLRGRKMRKGK